MNERSGLDRKDIFGLVNDLYKHIFLKENMIGSDFSGVHCLLSQQRRTLNTEYGDLQLKLTKTST